MKKHSILLITAFIGIAILFASCGGGGNNNNGGAAGMVYIAGRGLAYSATLWKYDGSKATAVHLSNVAGSVGRSVFVSDNTVYVAGDDYYGENAFLWKHDGTNTTTVRLSESGGLWVGSSVFVSGNTVYVAGTELSNYIRRPVLWKHDGTNTTTVRLADWRGCATSVYVSGSNVYVAGIDESINRSHIQVLWKHDGTNTTTVRLHNNLFPFYRDDDECPSVAVSNGTVYVVGHSLSGYNYYGVLWKLPETNLTDKTEVFLSEEYRGKAHSIFIGK
jgi:hypothetical protein